MGGRGGRETRLGIADAQAIEQGKEASHILHGGNHRRLVAVEPAPASEPPQQAGPALEAGAVDEARTAAPGRKLRRRGEQRARVESQSLSRHHRAAPAREPAGIPIRETVEHDHGNPAPRRRRRERAARYRSDEKGLHGGAGQTYAPRYPCP